MIAGVETYRSDGVVVAHDLGELISETVRVFTAEPGGGEGNDDLW